MPVDTSRWPALAAQLRPLAKRWKPVDGEGFSHCEPSDDAAVHEDLIALVNTPLFRTGIVFTPLASIDQPGHLLMVARATSLASYMLGSGLSISAVEQTKIQAGLRLVLDSFRCASYRHRFLQFGLPSAGARRETVRCNHWRAAERFNEKFGLFSQCGNRKEIIRQEK